MGENRKLTALPAVTAASVDAAAQTYVVTANGESRKINLGELVTAGRAIGGPLPINNGGTGAASAAAAREALGLGAVNNTPDASKPVSTVQQAALDAKAALSGAAFTGPVSATGGTVMTAGWDRTLRLTANFPTIVFSSVAAGKFGALGFDGGDGFRLWLGATDVDVPGSAPRYFHFMNNGALRTAGPVQAVHAIVSETCATFQNNSSEGYGLMCRGGGGARYSLRVEDYTGAGLFQVGTDFVSVATSGGVALTRDNATVSFYNTAGTRRGYLGVEEATGNIYLVHDTSGRSWLIGPNGWFLPNTDGQQNLGRASNRVNTVYAASGAINTSDARLKTPIRPLTPAEIAAAKALSAELGAYKFLSAISEKGEAGARLHIGMTVQRAMAIMEAEGLDPLAYGFICHDAWDGVDAVTDGAGVVVSPARPAGDSYAFRPDELLFFIARGFEARLAILEAA